MIIINNKRQSLRNLLLSYNLGKAKIHNLYMNKDITVNGDVINYDKVMELNDEININLDEENKVIPYDFNIDIIYEDDYILAVNKPMGIIIHSDTNDALINAVSNYFIKNNIKRMPRFVNRIDNDTTGIVLFSKDIITQSKLDNDMSNRLIDKYYLAIVDGITKNNDTIRLKIIKDRHSNKMVTAKSGDLAITHYKKIKEISRMSLLEVKLETGKTHQIRVHMSAIGHPLVGDMMYGNNNLANRQLLHAYKMIINHPFLNKKITITAKIPKDMNKFIEG